MTDYNVGSNTTITVMVNGAVLATAILTSFEAQQVTAELKSIGLDGENRYRHVPQGWNLSLEWDRADPSLDNFFAAAEDGQYAGLAPPRITITETTVNVDQTISKFRYTKISLKYDSIGKRAGDAKVESKASGFASRRIRVA